MEKKQGNKKRVVYIIRGGGFSTHALKVPLPQEKLLYHSWPINFQFEALENAACFPPLHGYEQTMSRID
jgi:hypothetical protein